MELENTKFDALALLKRCGSDPVLASEIAAVFVKNSAKYLTELEQGVRDESAEMLRVKAHALKGAISYFGAAAAFEAAYAIEKASNNYDLTELPQLMENMKVELNRLVSDLKRWLKEQTDLDSTITK